MPNEKNHPVLPKKDNQPTQRQPTPTARNSKSQFRKYPDLSKYGEKGIKRFREMSPVLREPLQAQTPPRLVRIYIRVYESQL